MNLCLASVAGMSRVMTSLKEAVGVDGVDATCAGVASESPAAMGTIFDSEAPSVCSTLVAEIGCAATDAIAPVADSFDSVRIAPGLDRSVISCVFGSVNKRSTNACALSGVSAIDAGACASVAEPAFPD